MTHRARNRRTTALTSTGLLVLTTFGTLVLTERSAQAAAETLYVDWDAASPGIACTQASPCETIEEAIQLVTDGTLYDNDAVTIVLGAGNQYVNGAQLEPDGDGINPTSIAFVGAGAGSTVIQPLGGHNGSVLSLQVPYPVSFSGLTVTGARGASGDVLTPNGGARGQEVAGIDSTGTGAVSVTDVVVTDIQGGAGGTGNHPNASADGGSGAHGVGIRARGDLTVTRTVISHIRGGDGASGTVGANTDPTSFGGSGGEARALDADGSLRDVQVSASTLTDLYGGDGGAGGSGTTNGVGGRGGSAIGVNDYNSDITVTRSTVSRLRGGSGGSSVYGSGFQGGFALGLTSEGGGQSNLVTSTITDLVSGNGGNGSGTPTAAGGNSGYAAGIDLYEAEVDAPGAVSVVSSTISAISLGTPGTGIGGGQPTNVIGIAQDSGTLAVTASLIAVPGAVACSSSSPVGGTGHNVVSDGTCGAGTNKIVPGIASTLGALGANGGPTRTIPLLAGSPARNAIPAPNAFCAASDQRGAARPNTAGTACDAGAFEASETAPPAPPAPPKPAAKATCDGKTATKVGTNGNDVITGTSGRDIIAGLGGNDTIRGLGGNDLICGGSGRDTISGRGGHDKLIGGDGNDTLSGGDGRDRLSGGDGRDRLSGGRGNDVLLGGAGNDRGSGGPGQDRIRSL